MVHIFLGRTKFPLAIGLSSKYRCWGDWYGKNTLPKSGSRSSSLISKFYKSDFPVKMVLFDIIGKKIGRENSAEIWDGSQLLQKFGFGEIIKKKP